MLDKITETSLLYDFYGQLLTERKRQVMELYHEENCSLSEIAEDFGISRAAVHDSLKSAEKSLREYEEKLGLVKRFVRSSEAIGKIDQMIATLSEKYVDNTDLVEELDKIKKVIDSMEE